ncbi:MAG: hypothetical protein A2234_04660 [Elusimicrobia bacterium RIFOXYA2_FULL_58_8]|nr:MAG: hypothetical protein A2234_04660 [Elusimicrobia bacterium RIFOXYA2_FULL_58_8]OGS14006.1 MAG: hypothetical protein A2285_02805 [Elusimicrobia bacterium RIFOXYA12_FULL_57_11]
MLLLNNRVLILLPAALALTACAGIPRVEKIKTPPYLSIQVGHHDTLGEFLVITPSFNILLPETDREQLSYLETQVASFDRTRLYKDNSYGADRTIPTNDKKIVSENMTRYGRTTKVTPEALTISAKFIPGKNPRIVLTANPNILDGDGTLHFSLEEQAGPKALKNTARIKLLPQESDAAAEPSVVPAIKKTASIRAYLQKKYGKTVKLKRGGAVVSASGKPMVVVEVELTLFLETARVTFNGTIKNLGREKIWATYYFPNLTYRKGRDWFTFTTRQFADSAKGRDMSAYYISTGTEKKFQFTTDPELQVLVYDSSLKKVAARNAFSSKEEDDLLKFEILEKYLADSPEVRLEVFPDKRICADCGVRLY